MMKKLLSLLVIVCMTVFCLSCHKDDNNKSNGNNNNSSQGTEDPSGGDEGGYVEGVYQPSKKISRVTSTGQTNGTTHNVLSIWNWENNNLKGASSYLNGVVDATVSYSYQSNRLVRMDYFVENTNTIYFNGYVECRYEGNKIKEANTYVDGQLSATYTYTYTNGYVTRIDAHYFNITRDDAKKAYYGLLGISDVNLNQIKGNEIPQYQAKTNGSSTFNLIWNNGNITRVEATSNIYSLGSYIVETEYDTYNNPQHGWFWAAVACYGIAEGAYGGEGTSGLSIYSKNNRIRQTVTYSDEDMVWQYSYNYTYEGTYPKTLTLTSTIYDIEVVSVSEYEYLN